MLDLSLDGEMPVRHREGWKSMWCDVRVHRDEALREFPETNIAEVEASEKDKGGRPQEYDWDLVKAYALGLVQEHGRPGEG